TEERVDGGDQDGRLHRFREVRVRSALEAERAMTRAHERRGEVDHGNRRGGGIRLDATTHLEAAHVGEVDVEQHDRRLVDGRDLKGLFTARRLAHVEARLLQDLSTRVAPRAVVVDVQENRAGDVHGQEAP